MGTVSERLTSGAVILASIDRIREEQGDPGRGWAVEQRIIAREIDELERQFLPVPVVVVRSASKWQSAA